MIESLGNIVTGLTPHVPFLLLGLIPVVSVFVYLGSQRNTVNKSLKTLAYILEIFIIGLGMIAAYTELLNSKESASLSILFFMYLSIIAIAEGAKLLVSEKVVKHPRPVTILFGIPTLFLALSFSVWNLQNVASKVEDFALKDSQDQRLDIKKYERFIDRKSNDLLVIGNDIAKATDHLNSLQSSESTQIKLLNAQIEDHQKSIDKIYASNNHSQLKNVDDQIDLLINERNQLRDRLQQIYEQKSILKKESLVEASEVINSSGFFSRTNTRKIVEKHNDAIELDFKVQIDRLTSEMGVLEENYERLIVNRNNLRSLSPKNKSDIYSINQKIQNTQNQIELLTTSRNQLISSLQGNLEQLKKNKLAIESEINETKITLDDHLNTLAGINSNSFFQRVASSWFKIEPSELSVEQVKTVSNAFLKISSIALALIPVMLIVIANLQPSPLPAQGKQKTKDFFNWLNNKKTINESFSKLKDKCLEEVSKLKQECTSELKQVEDIHKNTVNEINLDNAKKIEAERRISSNWQTKYLEKKAQLEEREKVSNFIRNQKLNLQQDLANKQETKNKIDVNKIKAEIKDELMKNQKTVINLPPKWLEDDDDN